MDDALGDGAWLITRVPVERPPSGVRVVILDDGALAPFRPALAAWLEKHATDAVLVRPDRYVFGAGDPRMLLDAWETALRPASAMAAAP